MTTCITIRGWVENRRIMLHDKTWFLTLTPVENTGVPKGVRGIQSSNHHWIFRIFWNCRLLNILSKVCSYIHKILSFLQENVKKLYTNFTFCFWGTSFPRASSGALPLGPTGGLPSARPTMTRLHHVNPLHCKIPGTPMVEKWLLGAWYLLATSRTPGWR